MHYYILVNFVELRRSSSTPPRTPLPSLEAQSWLAQSLPLPYVTWTWERASDTGAAPSVRYSISKILGYVDTVQVLDTGTGIRKSLNKKIFKNNQCKKNQENNICSPNFFKKIINVKMVNKFTKI